MVVSPHEVQTSAFVSLPTIQARRAYALLSRQTGGNILPSAYYGGDQWQRRKTNNKSRHINLSPGSSHERPQDALRRSRSGWLLLTAPKHAPIGYCPTLQEHGVITPRVKGQQNRNRASFTVFYFECPICGYAYHDLCYLYTLPVRVLSFSYWVFKVGHITASFSGLRTKITERLKHTLFRKYLAAH